MRSDPVKRGVGSETGLTAAQCRMARAGLSWGVRDLASAARVSGTTIIKLEQGGKLHERTVAAIRSALETAGVEFTIGSSGVSLREKE